MSDETSTLRRVMTWLAPIVIVTLAVVLIVLAQRGDGSTPQGSAPPASAPAGGTSSETPGDAPTDARGYAAEHAKNRIKDMARRDAEDPLARGEIDAPVVMVVYSDYQCQYCAMWVDRTQADIMEKYVDTGKVRIEWRDVNIFGPASRQGAKAAYAAGLQGKFWTFHDSLYSGGKHPSEAELEPEALVERALALALDGDKFQTDMDSDVVSAAVKANEEEGTGIGAFSTPTFIINGIPVAGAQPTEIFEAIIDSELEAADK